MKSNRKDTTTSETIDATRETAKHDSRSIYDNQRLKKKTIAKLNTWNIDIGKKTLTKCNL